eukprot:TRINITY_DN4505_c0_g1_i2.p1 TRINITY_DN4505_c0_g1~~TRINITY_DN4505_c0_g1_i2.p1  ORF type:complete len:407 (+),score=96.44 TRINITY_DN4505_c0_g1_i2:90-1310(+)
METREPAPDPFADVSLDSKTVSGFAAGMTEDDITNYVARLDGSDSDSDPFGDMVITRRRPMWSSTTGSSSFIPSVKSDNEEFDLPAFEDKKCPPHSFTDGGTVLFCVLCAAQVPKLVVPAPVVPTPVAVAHSDPISEVEISEPTPVAPEPPLPVEPEPTKPVEDNSYSSLPPSHPPPPTPPEATLATKPTATPTASALAAAATQFSPSSSINFSVAILDPLVQVTPLAILGFLVAGIPGTVVGIATGITRWASEEERTQATKDFLKAVLHKETSRQFEGKDLKISFSVVGSECQDRVVYYYVKVFNFGSPLAVCTMRYTEVEKFHNEFKFKCTFPPKYNFLTPATKLEKEFIKTRTNELNTYFEAVSRDEIVNTRGSHILAYFIDFETEQNLKQNGVSAEKVLEML